MRALQQLGICISVAGVVFASSVARPLGTVVVAASPACTVAFGFYQPQAPWTPDGLTAFSQTESRLGRSAAIMHWYQAWGESGANSREFSPVLLRSARSHGSTPMVTWSPWDVTLPPAQTTFPLRRIAAGDFDAYIDSWATGMRDYHDPVLVRFAHEMQGDWYPWGAGVNGNTPADYIAAFRHVHNRFALRGAGNVQWVWSPNHEDPAYPSLRDFYPGDEYVDWLGPDVYNYGTTTSWSSWQSFETIFQPTYDGLMAVNRDKPVMLSEWASAEEGGDKGQWIRDAAQVLPARFPRIHAAVWFNEGGSTAMDSSPGSLAGARDAFGSSTFCSTLQPAPEAPPAVYRPVDPVRILDSRDGTGGRSRPIGPGEAVTVLVAGANGVDPAASAAVLNVTVANPSDASYLTLYPSGQTRPNASSLNFLPGQQMANLVQVEVGDGGRITVLNDRGYADVVVDLNGFYVPAATAGNAGLFFPLANPTRVLDTRGDLGGHRGRLGPGATLKLQLAGTPGLPSSGVWAAVMNLTAVNGTSRSYLAAYPAGGANLSSNLNFPPGNNLANRAIVKVSGQGAVAIYNSEGWVDVVADVAGYYRDGSGSPAGGVPFHATPPLRLIDTRPEYQVGPFGQPLGPGGVLTAATAGHGLVPLGATAVSGNFTVTGGGCGSFLTVYPADQPLPLASDLSFGPNDVRPSLVIVKLGGPGALNAYNNLCSTDLIIDIAGWYG